MNQRKIRIRCKGHGRLRFLTVIIAQVTGAALFIGTQDQAGSLCQRNPQLLHRFHGVQRRDGRSLVIGAAPSINSSVCHLGFKRRRHRPIFTDRDHIQMGQNIQLFFFLRV